VDMALGSQRWAPLSVVTFPRLKKICIAMCNMDSRDQKCILLCAIWIWTKNAYCYVQYYGFARPKMKVEVEEKAPPPVECSGLVFFTS
jgi:hypothetical protein